MSRNFQVTVIPTIVITGLDPAEVASDYFNGVFSNIVNVGAKIKIPRTSEDGIMNPTHSICPSKDIFSFNSRSGVEMVFVTTNNINFKTHHFGNPKTGEPVECRWCTLPFTEGMGGIPVAVTQEFNDKRELIPAVWTIENICDYECALARVMSTKSDPKIEGWVRLMHSLSYPGASRLKCAPDPSHLIKHGGNYTPEQYKSKRFTFINTCTFVMYPAKQCYQRVSNVG